MKRNVLAVWWSIFDLAKGSNLFPGEDHSTHQQIPGAAACGRGCYLP